MNIHIEKIEKAIEPLRAKIITHPVYSAINEIEDLNIFMKYHVFAVWDFMSLLKSLQNQLTCTSVPWFPVGSADTRALINEIVAGEESDIDFSGTKKSHFEMYLDAMEQSDADTAQISKFLECLKSGDDLNTALSLADTPEAAQQFVKFTFEAVKQPSHVQAAVFTFGREDLIPSMFLSIVNDFYQRLPQSVSIFKYYLERHIEVDGDHHSHLALAMTANLCGDNEEFWQQAEDAAIQSLQERINLWDGVYNELVKSPALK